MQLSLKRGVVTVLLGLALALGFTQLHAPVMPQPTIQIADPSGSGSSSL